jgi:hypothetical protein
MVSMSAFRAKSWNVRRIARGVIRRVTWLAQPRSCLWSSKNRAPPLSLLI